MSNTNGAFHYSNAHSNFTVKWPIKTEHSAFKAVVTRVTLPKFCDSRYIWARTSKLVHEDDKILPTDIEC